MNSLQQNKETPIDALPSDNNFQNNEKEDNELVNNILKEIQEESVDNNEMQALSYQMDNQVKMEQPNINLDNQIPSGETMQQFDDLSDTGLTLNKSIEWLKNYGPTKNYIKEVKTACLWKKKSSSFEPDFCPIKLNSDPWIVQPTEHYEELSIEEIIKKNK